MSTDPPPSSRRPSGVPHATSTTSYIVVIVFILVALCGLVVWKLKGLSHEPTPSVPKAVPTAVSSPPKFSQIDDVPPPPVLEPTVSVEAGASEAAMGGGGAYNPCDPKITCSGNVTRELELALGMRGKQARHCYDQALGQDSTLEGRVGIKVRVANNGQVCTASVASDELSNPIVAQCMAGVFRQSGRMPTPKGGCVEVTIPILLKAH